MIWRIFTRDVFRLLKNPVAVVITLGVALIPSLYAWCNIVANWDPYANTGNIKVAVANEDQGANNELIGRLNAGQNVVSALKNNHELGWQFVDEDTAKQGVQSGEYYAALVIPKDFSSKLIGTVTSIASDTSADGGDTSVTRGPRIDYYVNEKRNAIAPKITDSGATTVDETINHTFVSTVSSTVAKTIKQAGKKLSDNADTSRKRIDQSIDQAKSDLDDAQNTIATVNDTITAAETALSNAQKSLTALNKQVTSTQRTLGTANGALGEARKESLSFTNTLNDGILNGTSNLSGILVAANTASGSIANGFTTAQNGIDEAVGSQQAIIDQNAAVIGILQQLLNNSNSSGAAGSSGILTDAQRQQLQTQIDTLQQANWHQQQALNTFSKDASTITNGGIGATQNAGKAIGTAAQGGIRALNTTRNGLNHTVTPSLLAGMDSFSAMAGTLGGTLSGLTSTISQTQNLITQLADTLDETRTTLDSTAKSLDSLADQLDATQTDVAALENSEFFGRIKKSLNLDDAAIGDFMAAPVALATKIVYPVANYGSAVAPFYSNLALWVGGFVLIAIFKLEVDREGLQHLRDSKGRKLRLTATQAYLGRWLLLVTVGLMQALICTIGDLIIGIQCEHPLPFLLAGCWTSFVYVNIIYALAVAFKHIGKAVAVILVILQIPGSSGMYPIEMMPDFFQRLNPFLPFTYGINAMRETIGGMYSGHYWDDMRSLLWFLLAALFIGLVARPYLLNLNALFDRRLGATDLMVAEQNNLTNERFRLVSVIKLLMGVPEYRQQIRDRAHAFFRWYPRLIRIGFVAIVVIPLVFLILMFSVESKIVMLTAWITSIILIDVFLIVVEYMADNASRQLGISGMHNEDFRDVLTRRLGGAGTGGAGTTVREAEKTSNTTAAAAKPVQSDGKEGDR